MKKWQHNFCQTDEETKVLKIQPQVEDWKKTLLRLIWIVRLRACHGRTLPPTTHNKSRVVHPIRQIVPKNKKIKQLKFIDKAKQGVYIGVFKCAEFKNGIYFVIRPLLHCVLALFLSKVSSIRQIVVGWIFGNIRPLSMWSDFSRR